MRGHADTLQAQDFEQYKAGPRIFRKILDGVVIMVVGVYVDDLLVGGPAKESERQLQFPTNHLVTWCDRCSIERMWSLAH